MQFLGLHSYFQILHQAINPVVGLRDFAKKQIWSLSNELFLNFLKEATKGLQVITSACKWERESDCYWLPRGYIER